MLISRLDRKYERVVMRRIIESQRLVRYTAVMSPPVALNEVRTYHGPAVRQALQALFDQLGGLNTFVKRGQYVLIKPNLIAGRLASQTHPVVVIELAKLVREAGCRVAVADSPAWASIPANTRKSGLWQLAEQHDIPLFELGQPVQIDAVGPGPSRRVTVSRHALEADVIINVPKLKAHQQLMLTAGVKNMFGVVPGKRKAWWHFRAGNAENRFAERIVEIYLALAPTLTIIDGIEVMQGPGPVRGPLRGLGVLIASPDAFAAELVACQLVGCDPATLPIMRAGWQLGVAPISPAQVTILGPDPADLAVTDFAFPEQAPVMFSLPRVMASTCKQAWIRCMGIRRSDQA